MSETVLNAETGRRTGSSDSRRLRADGSHPRRRVRPRDGADQHLGQASRAAPRALRARPGMNTILDLTVDGKVYPSIIKDIQRHPVKRNVAHIDFIQVNLNEEITVSVPIILEGEAKEVSPTTASSTSRCRNCRSAPRRADPRLDHHRRHRHDDRLGHPHRGHPAAGGCRGHRRARRPGRHRAGHAARSEDREDAAPPKPPKAKRANPTKPPKAMPPTRDRRHRPMTVADMWQSAAQIATRMGLFGRVGKGTPFDWLVVGLGNPGPKVRRQSPQRRRASRPGARTTLGRHPQGRSRQRADGRDPVRPTSVSCSRSRSRS